MLVLVLSMYMSGKWSHNETQWREVTMEEEKGKGHLALSQDVIPTEESEIVKGTLQEYI